MGGGEEEKIQGQIPQEEGEVDGKGSSKSTRHHLHSCWVRQCLSFYVAQRRSDFWSNPDVGGRDLPNHSLWIQMEQQVNVKRPEWVPQGPKVHYVCECEEEHSHLLTVLLSFLSTLLW